MKNSRFLKRGEGFGGGKAMLEVKSGGNNLIRDTEKVTVSKKKDKYEIMLESCLAKREW